MQNLFVHRIYILNVIAGLTACALVAVSGCSSLQGTAAAGVKSRMTQREVSDLLGQPERIVHSEADPREVTWVYYLDGELCQITFRLGQVYARPACMSTERKKEIDALALDREPGARALIKAQERERRLKEEEDTRFTRHLREPQ